MVAARGDGKYISTVLNLFSKPPVPINIAKDEGLLLLGTALQGARAEDLAHGQSV